jgi:hypothetical protein
VRVLAIWEPILVTDWRAPSGSTLARMSDARVQQFWDPKHVVSIQLNQMETLRRLQAEPNSGEGFYWDEAILYGPHSKWKDAPTPLFWSGPVYQVISGLGTALGGTAPKAQ